MVLGIRLKCPSALLFQNHVTFACKRYEAAWLGGEYWNPICITSFKDPKESNAKDLTFSTVFLHIFGRQDTLLSLPCCWNGPLAAPCTGGGGEEVLESFVPLFFPILFPHWWPLWIHKYCGRGWVGWISKMNRQVWICDGPPISGIKKLTPCQDSEGNTLAQQEWAADPLFAPVVRQFQACCTIGVVLGLGVTDSFSSNYSNLLAIHEGFNFRWKAIVTCCHLGRLREVLALLGARLMLL